MSKNSFLHSILPELGHDEQLTIAELTSGTVEREKTKPRAEERNRHAGEDNLVQIPVAKAFSKLKVNVV